MATQRKRYRKDGSPSGHKLQWRARVKVDYIEEFLGYYATKEEAEAVEEEFKKAAAARWLDRYDQHDAVPATATTPSGDASSTAATT